MSPNSIDPTATTAEVAVSTGSDPQANQNQQPALKILELIEAGNLHHKAVEISEQALPGDVSKQRTMTRKILELCMQGMQVAVDGLAAM